MADIDVERDREHRHVLERTGFRLSWGAIIAGLVVALVIQMVLSLLGLAIGLTTWEVGEGLGGFGSAAGVWAAISGLVALFIGGLTTGRLAGVLTLGDGAVHGIIMWGLSTLVGVWLVLAGAGVLLGGVFDIVGQTVSATAGAAAEVGTTAVTQSDGIDFDALEGEVQAMLRQSGVPELQPESLEAAAEEARDTVLQPAGNQEVAGAIVDLVRERAGSVDRQAILNVITARTDLSQAEAERLASRVESATVSAQADISRRADTLGARAEEYGEEARQAAASGLWWVLLAMALSAAAAAGGAAMTARD